MKIRQCSTSIFVTLAVFIFLNSLLILKLFKWNCFSKEVHLVSVECLPVCLDYGYGEDDSENEWWNQTKLQ